MVKTKIDTYGVLITLVVTFLLIALSIWMSYEWFISEDKIGVYQRMILTAICLIITPLLFAVELPKLKMVEISEGKMVLVNLLTRSRTEILIEAFDGFRTTSQWTRGGAVHEIILIVRKKPVHDISSNYVKNYNEIRDVLNNQLQNLGSEKFQYFKYLRDRLAK